MWIKVSKAIHISWRLAADNLSLYFDVKDECSVILRRPLDKCVVTHQNKMGYLVIHLIISLKSNILRNTLQWGKLYHTKYFYFHQYFCSNQWKSLPWFIILTWFSFLQLQMHQCMRKYPTFMEVRLILKPQSLVTYSNTYCIRRHRWIFS